MTAWIREGGRGRCFGNHWRVFDCSSQNSFRKNRKTPTDPKATTRTYWVPFLPLNDWRIPSSPRHRERKPTTYCGALPQNATTKAGRPCFSYHHLQPAQPPPTAETGAQQHARHRPQHASAKFSKAKPSPTPVHPKVVVFWMEVK